MSNVLRCVWALGGPGSGVQAQQVGAGSAAGIGAGTIPGTPFGGAIDPSMVQMRFDRHVVQISLTQAFY